MPWPPTGERGSVPDRRRRRAAGEIPLRGGQRGLVVTVRSEDARRTKHSQVVGEGLLRRVRAADPVHDQPGRPVLLLDEASRRGCGHDRGLRMDPSSPVRGARHPGVGDPAAVAALPGAGRYVTMLFLYAWLAEWEEERYLARFGESYQSYQSRTGRFLPRAWHLRMPRLLLHPGLGGVRRPSRPSCSWSRPVSCSASACAGTRSHR